MEHLLWSGLCSGLHVGYLTRSHPLTPTPTAWKLGAHSHGEGIGAQINYATCLRVTPKAS